MSLEIGEVISSYLERAIPTLNKDENTRPITKQIWCSALGKMLQRQKYIKAMRYLFIYKLIWNDWFHFTIVCFRTYVSE